MRTACLANEQLDLNELDPSISRQTRSTKKHHCSLARNTRYVGTANRGGPIQRNARVRKKLGTLRTGPWLCSGSPLDLASEAPFPVRHEKAQVGLGSSAQVLKTPVVRLLQLTESARLESRALHVSKACGSSAAGCYGCKFIYAAVAQVAKRGCERRERRRGPLQCPDLYLPGHFL
jgi:hypothetical protein